MVKKLFSLMTVALLMASCTSDEIESVVSNDNGSTVSFEIALNEAAGTRAAISDGTTVDQLVWEVYDKDGKKVAGLSGSEAAFGKSKSHTLNLTLAKGQTYTVAFWAQKSGAYVTDDLTRIELNYDGVTGNNESRDAFYAYTEPITVDNGNFTHNVTLKRPFAQLNLAVSDLVAFQNAGITLDQVEVEVSEAAANFDVTTGEASSAVPAKFNLAGVLCNVDAENDILTLKNPIEVAEDVAKSSFPWISMNYLLVNGGKDNVDVKFTIKTSHDDVVLTSENTPVQSNYRTNLIAKLTNVGEFNIEIDPMYDAETNDNLADDEDPITYNVALKSTGKTYKSLAEALAVAGENDVITLAAGEYDVPSTRAATSELKIEKGITIQAAEGVDAADVKINGTVKMQKGTLKNVTLANATAHEALMVSAFYGDCEVEGVIFECPSTGTVNAFKEYSGWGDGETYSVVFKNCIFNTNGQRPLQFDKMNATVENCIINNPREYCVQLGEYAENCYLLFKNNVVKYGVSTQENPTFAYVYVADTGDSKNNVVVIEGNTNSTDNPSAKWEDFVIENTSSNVEITMAVADGVNIVKGVYEISNANGMFWFANEVNVNKKSFAGKTVKLTADVDLENKLWDPVGQTGNMTFQGVFDGGNKTIKNLKVDERSDNATYRAAGLFGWIEGTGEVKNVNIDGAEIYGHHYVAAVLAYSSGRPVSGCTVKNAKISCVFNTVKVDDGDKAGAIIGYTSSTVTNCVAYDCQIDAVRDAGQIAGAANPANLTECTAERVTVAHNNSAAGYNYDKDGWRIAERLVGYYTTRNDNH